MKYSLNAFNKFPTKIILAILGIHFEKKNVVESTSQFFFFKISVFIICYLFICLIAYI